MQIISPPPKTPVRSITHTEKPITPRGGLWPGEVRPNPIHLHSSVILCPGNHHSLLWSERAGEGATDSTGLSTVNGSCRASCFWLGKLREDWHQKAQGKPVLLLVLARAQQVRVRTQVLPHGGARGMLSRGCTGKLRSGRSASGVEVPIAEAGASAGPPLERSLYFGLCLELSVFF